ncbi:MAG: hypothetical protein GYA51_13930 [Candidatus Methanofastidiosa archaeon]|nr:hypothetical protein [Candidatus Methanofastidiosa archaeon]
MDYIIFLGIPLVISIIFVCNNILLTKDAINTLVTSLSIFAALLFNLLLLVYDFGRKIPNEPVYSKGVKETGKVEIDLKKKRIDFINEVYCNISFAILVSLISVGFLIVLTLTLDVGTLIDSIEIPYKAIMSGIIYFLMFVFILTMLMILKRTHNYLSTEFDSIKIKSD